MSSSPAPLTWLQAAEYVLREEGPDMHIKDLTSRILELGIVKSNCATSLETLLYRQTSGGPQGKGGNRGVTGPSKFTRVAGKHGWFGLKPSVLLEESDLNVSLESVDDILLEDKNSEAEMELEPLKIPNQPQQLYPRSRRDSFHSSDEEAAFFTISSDSSDSSDLPEDSEDDTSVDEGEQDPGDEQLYRKKFAFLKSLAKSMIFENAALADQLTIAEKKVRRMQKEREFLFKKLIQFERSGAPRRCVAGAVPFPGFLVKNQPPGTPPPPSQGASDTLKVPARQHPNRSRTRSVEEVYTRRPFKRAVHHASQSKKPKIEVAKSQPQRSEKQRSNLLLDNSELSSEGWSDSDGDLIIDTPVAPSVKREPPRKRKEKKEPAPPPVKRNVEEDMCDEGEDEELELAMRSGKVRRLHPIPLNADGSPVFPIVVGGLKVFSLGKIVWDRVAYHSERYLLPVGFESSRVYPSMIDPSKKCSYTCKILDGGEAPLFEMVAADDVEHPVRATSSTACQTIVLKNINKARDKQATNSGSGPEFFGYSNPTILNLLQKMPEAKKCAKYKFVRFAEPSRRGGGGQKVKGTAKAKTAKKVKKTIPAKRTLDPNLFDSSRPLTTGPKQVLSAASVSDSSPAIAPVLGTAGQEVQYGMEVGGLSYSSSDDSSSATDNELIIDS